MDSYHSGEEDLFDQEFGDLPPNTLHQLERDAITLSQRQPRTEQPGRPAKTGPPHPQTEINGVTGPPSSDYGYSDDDVIDLDDPGVSFSANDPPFRPGKLSNGQSSVQQHVARPSHQTKQVTSGDGDLEARIQDLENERLRLTEALDQAQSENRTKSGALSVLRSGIERTTREHDAKLAGLVAAHASAIEKLKTEIRIARDDNQNVKTSNKFLEHDLAEERERSKKMRTASTNGNGSRNSASKDVSRITTPKKISAPDYRDGFDDFEMLNPSPTKIKDKLGTPKHGAKRKRAVANEAIDAQDVQKPHQESPKKIEAIEGDLDREIRLLVELDLRDEHLSVVQMVLNHRTIHSPITTMQILSQHIIPESHESQASIILSSLSSDPSTEILPASVHIRSTCMDLWERLLLARYWPTLPHVMHLIGTMLARENSKQQVLLHERLIPLVAKTCVIVAEPRVVKAGQVGNLPQRVVKATADKHDIDDRQVLEILHRVGISASLHERHAVSFWQRMEFAFVMLMLNEAQPLSHPKIMLSLIRSSVLEDSFGPRSNDAEIQAKQESALIDRLTNSLTAGMRQDEHEHSTTDLLHLCNDVLATLKQISMSRHGSESIARHRTAIGRLARLLCDQINALYRHRPRPSFSLHSGFEPVQSRTSDPHGLLIEGINITTKIMYHLIRENDFDLLERMSVIHGGPQKLKLALSRLAFSERTYLEEGISDEVCDAAHEILDTFITPEEGLAIQEAMETPRGTRGGDNTAMDTR